MKLFMKTCYKDGEKVKIATIEKEGITLKCLRCTKCGEEYFTSSELMKFDILSGKKQNVRKFGQLGDSTIVRLPPKTLEKHKIHPGDYAIFDEVPEGILIKPVHAKELKTIH